MNGSVASKRRLVKFNSVDDATAELDRLRPDRYRKVGSWSLPQACRHLAMTIEGSLTPPPSDDPTPEETAMKQKFFGMVLSPAGMPEKLPIGNPDLIPSADCTDAEVDHLKTALQSLINYQHKCVKVGRCGPVPIKELIEIHLAHIAHHLSFLEPISSRRVLNFDSIDQLVSDVQHLRKGYVKVGQWSLPQICRHLNIATTNTAKAPTEPPSPTQVAARSTLEKVLASGKIPQGLQSPDKAVPPSDCNDADIDAYLATMDRMQPYAEPISHHPRFGPLTLPEFQRIILIHAAHHLSHLVPTTDN